MQSDNSQFDTLFDYGHSLFRRDQCEEALAVFQQMQEKWPNSVPVQFMIGALYFFLCRYELAIHYLEKVTRSCPKKEYPSRVLFLSRWRNGQIDLAYAEIERFVLASGRYSEKYELHLRDLRGEVGEEEFDKIAEIIEEKKRFRKLMGEPVEDI